MEIDPAQCNVHRASCIAHRICAKKGGSRRGAGDSVLRGFREKEIHQKTDEVRRARARCKCSGKEESPLLFT